MPVIKVGVREFREHIASFLESDTPVAVTRHGETVGLYTMREMAISEFKTKCLALLEEVSKTKQPIRITRRGKPVAEVVPVFPLQERRKLGSMAGTVKILGDIVAPIIDPNEWEASRD